MIDVVKILEDCRVRKLNCKPNDAVMNEGCFLMKPICIAVGMTGSDTQEANAMTPNSLTWARCIHDPEGGWPRGACSIALRAR